MIYIPQGPKRPVNMSLSEDLVKEARTLTSNLSETVEALLAVHVAAEKARLEDKERRIDEALALIADHQAKHGLWDEAFSTL